MIDKGSVCKIPKDTDESVRQGGLHYTVDVKDSLRIQDLYYSPQIITLFL